MYQLEGLDHEALVHALLAVLCLLSSSCCAACPTWEEGNLIIPVTDAGERVG